MVELKTFRTIHSNNEFEGDWRIGGYQVELSGLLRLHFCEGDDVTPAYEEYEIAQISIDSGGYDWVADQTPSRANCIAHIEEAILEEVTKQLSEDQTTLKDLWSPYAAS